MLLIGSKQILSHTADDIERKNFKHLASGLVCFRFRGIDNEELLLRLQESGIAVASSTTLDGKFAIRVAIVNHRTKLSDIEKFVEACILLGRQIERG